MLAPFKGNIERAPAPRKPASSVNLMDSKLERPKLPDSLDELRLLLQRRHSILEQLARTEWKIAQFLNPKTPGCCGGEITMDDIVKNEMKHTQETYRKVFQCEPWPSTPYPDC